MSAPNGQVIDFVHTSQMRLGDIAYVTFGITNAGYWKFGSEESLTVIQKTKDNCIRFRAEDGSIIPEPQNPAIGGSRERMLKELKKLSSFKEVRIIRPFIEEEEPEEPEEMEVLVPPMPQRAPVRTASPITPGNDVILGLGLYGIALYLAHNEDEDEYEEGE